MKKIHSLLLLSLVCLNVELLGASANLAIQVNFTGTLTKHGFVGPDSINPFLEGNALSTFIQSSGETDVVRVDGQFYMSDWDGSDGTFTSNVTPGVRFFLHSPFGVSNLTSLEEWPCLFPMVSTRGKFQNWVL